MIFFFQISTSVRPEYQIAVLMLCAIILWDLTDASVTQVTMETGKTVKVF